MDRTAKLDPVTRDAGPLPLFVYGTLLDPDLATGLLERPVASEPATLVDFEIVRIEGSPLPTIFAAEGETVAGRLYRDLTDADYERLDRYEGVGEGLYRREVGRVVAGATGAKPEPAHVYVVTEKTLRRLGAL